MMAWLAWPRDARLDRLRWSGVVGATPREQERNGHEQHGSQPEERENWAHSAIVGKSALPAVAGIRFFVHGKFRVAAMWFNRLAAVAFIWRRGKHDLSALVPDLSQQASYRLLHLMKAPLGFAPVLSLHRRTGGTHGLEGLLRVFKHVSSS